MKKVFVVFGTRPEVVKLAPVIRALRKRKGIATTLVATGQHRGLLRQMLSAFEIEPDLDFDLMREGQSPNDVMESVLRELGPLLRNERPELVLVQGDTTTAAAAALAAHNEGSAVGHVEAGLRSFDLSNPFPEEANRVLIDHISQLCFAPTKAAQANLAKEGIKGARVFRTGNTVVDAVRWAGSLAGKTESPALASVPKNKDLILVTLHRRESFGEPIERVFIAITELVQRYPNAAVAYPVHPNPNVKAAAAKLLKHPRIALLEPLDYFDFLQLMTRCRFLLTDSGGLQEEAPSLHKPVLVAREKTERPELLKAKGGILVGTDPKKIVREGSRLLTDSKAYRRMANCKNPFGDGKAGERIAAAVSSFLGLGPRPRDWGA